MGSSVFKLKDSAPATIPDRTYARTQAARAANRPDGSKSRKAKSRLLCCVGRRLWIGADTDVHCKRPGFYSEAILIRCPFSPIVAEAELRTALLTEQYSVRQLGLDYGRICE